MRNTFGEMLYMKKLFICMYISFSILLFAAMDLKACWREEDTINPKQEDVENALCVLFGYPLEDIRNSFSQIIKESCRFLDYLINW
jgi:hypothetical protein